MARGPFCFANKRESDYREILASLFGVEIARQLLEVHLEEDRISMSGYISPASLTRSNRREITFFVNGRWIQDAALSSALLQAYHTLLMVGRYPIAILFINLPPEEVDVNVHPAKAEVRFRDSDYMFNQVQRGVKRALLAYSPVAPLNLPTWPDRFSQPKIIDPAWDMASDSQSLPDPTNRDEGKDFPEESLEVESADQELLPSGQILPLTIIGADWTHLPGGRGAGWTISH